MFPVRRPGSTIRRSAVEVDGNVAFKCTYHDGPKSPYGIGFWDLCSQGNIIKNIENGRMWCNNSQCRDYYDANFSTDSPSWPCYESSILSDWQFASGGYLSGYKKNKPIQMKYAKKGKFAIMTTRPPFTSEEQRVIFAIMYLSSVEPSDKEEIEAIVHFNPYKSIVLKTNEWLYFWKYYSTSSGNPIWGTGLFRYLNDSEVKKILKDVALLKRFRKKSNIIRDLFEEF